MQDYISALTVAITNSFPDPITDYIYQNIIDDQSTFDINTLWPSVYDRNNTNALLTLIRLGANINHRMPDSGSTPTMYLAQNGFKEMVTILITKGADLTIKSNSGKDVYYYQKDGRIDVLSIIKEINNVKEKEELVIRNQMLENQCREMDNKLNYLLNAFQNMNVDESVLLHKKARADQGLIMDK